MISPAQIEWGPITPAGHAMLAEVAARQYNAIAAKYGAAPVPVPPCPLDAKPRPLPRYKLLGSADLAAMPALAWRVRGVIPAVGLAAIFGPSASGKSFLGFDMAAAIADGCRWFNCRVEVAPVVYAALEGEAGFKLRVQAWEAHHGRKLPPGLHMVLQPFKLTEPRDVRDLAAVVPAGAVVFIDTLNRAAPTADENSSKDMGEILEAAKRLQTLTRGLVVLIHHTGKDATKGLRGHSSLFAALDAAVEVSRNGDRREWIVSKSKDGQDGDAHPFKLQVETLGVDHHGDPMTSCVIQQVQGAGVRPKPLTSTHQIGMDSFMTAAAANIDDGDRQVHAHLDQWREEFYSRSTGDNPDSKRRSFNRVRKELVELGRLVVAEDVYRIPMGFGTNGTFAGHGPLVPLRVPGRDGTPP